MKRIRKALVVLTLTSLALAPAALAQDIPSYTFEAQVGKITGPQEIPAGLVTLTFNNGDETPHTLMLARLNDGVGMDQLAEAVSRGPEAGLSLVTMAGGFGPTLPGGSATITFDLKEAGSYVGFDMMSGGLIPIRVLEHGAQPERPQADLVVQMLDFGYDVPAEVRAGEQVWEVVNVGQEPHELILFKLQDGVTVADLIEAMEVNPEGEPPAERTGGVMPMGEGYSNFVTLDLAPGDYVAWCFIPSAAHDHEPHFALGMAKPFTVVAQEAGN